MLNGGTQRRVKKGPSVKIIYLELGRKYQAESNIIYTDLWSKLLVLVKAKIKKRKFMMIIM